MSLDIAAVERLIAEHEEGWAILHARRLLDLIDRIGTGLEAIARHDYRDLLPVATTEALLLREADMLDLIGMIGISRELAWGPNDLDVCYRRIRSRRDGIRGRLSIPAAREIAERRLSRMETCLQWFADEVAGTD